MKRAKPNLPLKICICCGQEFMPNSSRQQNCDKPITATCVVCGKEFTKRCSVRDKTETCNVHCMAELIKRRRTESSLKTEKICSFCGKKFHPKSLRDNYCYGQHYKICTICGKKFEVDPRTRYIPETCSSECRYKSAKQNTDMEHMVSTLKKTMMEKYGVENSVNIPGVRDKMKQTTFERYGTEWYTQTDEYKERAKQTSLEKYGTEHHLSAESVIAKRIATNLDKYGSNNVFASSYGKSKLRATMRERYGCENPSQNPELHKIAISSAHTSSLERKVQSLFEHNNIKFEHHYVIKVNELIHEFDFYLPDYKILVDCDGIYFHSYISDPDGKYVGYYYDPIRLEVVPNDHYFVLIVEKHESECIDKILDMISKIESGTYDYNKELFDWCRSVGFPYANYTSERLKKDYERLCKYQTDKYKPKARLSESSINHFHKSIFDAHIEGYPSPIQAWNDDDILKEAIRNRLIYMNDIDPFKVLYGFNVSKICPKVSVFNPVLARYLTKKYLSEFSTVFDPFSGFSGRLLGVASNGKSYIGQDLNESAVRESNEIIEFFGLQNCLVSHKDIFDSTGEYECLLTCPPYDKKEVYSVETVFQPCDDLIDECLKRFHCKRYVFVVDKTERYVDNIIEEIGTTSHFSTIREYVILIDKN